MLVYCKISGVDMQIVDNAPLLAISATAGFNNNGTAVNTVVVAYVSGVNLVTALLVDNQVRIAVKNYVNSNYGLSIHASDVILSGGFNVPLL